MRYASCETWAEWFEGHEGVRILGETIRDRLKGAKKIGEDGRGRLGQLFKGAYYSEQDVRDACADLLRQVPLFGRDGFVEIGGIRYGTVKFLAGFFGVSAHSIFNRLGSSDIIPVCCRSRGGRLYDLYSVSQVQKLLLNLLDPTLIRVGDDGFADIAGVRHGSKEAFANLLGISTRSISSRLSTSGLMPVRGKDSENKPVDLWSESAVYDLCVDLLDSTLIRVGEDGFVFISGVRHGKIVSFSRIFRVSIPTILKRLRSSGIVPVRCRGRVGRLCDLYPETAVRELCADLLAPLPVAEESGFVMVNGVRCGTIPALARLLGLGRNTVRRRLVISTVVSVPGRDGGGKLCDLYPEPAVRELCRDLIKKRKK